MHSQQLGWLGDGTFSASLSIWPLNETCNYYLGRKKFFRCGFFPSFFLHCLPTYLPAYLPTYVQYAAVFIHLVALNDHLLTKPGQKTFKSASTR